MNPWAIGAIGVALGAWCGFRFGKVWQREGDKVDAMLRRYRDQADDDSDDYKPPAAGPPVPPHRAAAGEPPRLPHPLPGQPGQAASPPPVPDHDDHGGVVTTVVIHRCGYMTITDLDAGQAEEYHGECPACQASRCYLCGFRMVYDQARHRWVQAYEHCPAHAGKETADGV